jgi:hypothetical protein
VDDVVVVLGAYDVETDARVVRCDEWERGPGASLRCGLAALPPEAAAAVRDRVRETAAAYETPDGLEVPGLALVASARRA